jgi:ADP-ribosylation factor-like protein 2
MNFWDLGGQKSIRPFWRNYYEETDAIVWVIDSADAGRLEDCRRELESILTADVKQRQRVWQSIINL